MKEDTALAIGQALVSAREASGISLQDVADRTRISISHLRALEAGNFETLPGVGYIPGFIRNYCQAVGIDAAPHVDSFKSLSSVATKKPEYSFPVQALVPRVAGSMIAMFAVLVGLAVYVGWTFFSYKQTDEPALIASSISQTEQPDVMLENTAGQTDAQTAPLIEQGPAAEQSGAAVYTQNTDDPAQLNGQQTDKGMVAEIPPQPKPEAVITAPQQEAATAPADTPAPTVSETAALSPELTTGTSPDPAADQANTDQLDTGPVAGVGAQATQRLPGEEVIIRATASSWVEVTREDGEVLVTKLMREGDRLVFSSDENLFLSTGNAGGLRLEMPNVDAFDAGQTGEILRDLRLNHESIQNRRLLASY